jgi:hypothetical protein
VFTYGAEGKYGITDKMDNEVTKDYYRTSVREFLLTYPLLAGLGITAGENMWGSTEEKEDWLWETYGLGIKDALRQQPGRDFRLVHRVWWTDLNVIVDKWGDFPGEFDFSTKYSQARLFSGTDPIYSDRFFNELPDGQRMWLNLRNDDLYQQRWGDPDFVQAFLKNIPPNDQCPGYQVGSDGYFWGKDFSSKDPRLRGQFELDKHWYNWMLWGRLGFDRNMDKTIFRDMINHRFPDARGHDLYTAWKNASYTIPATNRFHFNQWDMHWLCEYNISNMYSEEGWQPYTQHHTLLDWVDCQTMPGENIMTIPEYVSAELGDKDFWGLTPVEVADRLDDHADAAMAGIAGIKTSDVELQYTLGDIQGMAYLGKYYADKIRGALNYWFFRQTKKGSYRDEARKVLKEAVHHWLSYAGMLEGQYEPQVQNRIEILVDWYGYILDEVLDDVVLAGGAPYNDVAAFARYPRMVEPSETCRLQVSYSASTNRIITVSLKDKNAETEYGKRAVNVSAFAGSVDLAVIVPGDLPPGDHYEWTVEVHHKRSGEKALDVYTAAVTVADNS